jgi:hypothetical protein
MQICIKLFTTVKNDIKNCYVFVTNYVTTKCKHNYDFIKKENFFLNKTNKGV